MSDVTKTYLTAENIRLGQQVDTLRRDNERLRIELEYLKTHPTISQGMKGETLTAKLLQGVVTSYGSQWDVTLSSGQKIEVKFSKLNTPNLQGKSRRWNWSKIFGESNKGKDFDWLLLIGDKDPRYPNQYLDDSPYVFFLIPQGRVEELITKAGRVSLIQLTSKFSKVRSFTGHKVLEYKVDTTFIEEHFGHLEIAEVSMENP